MPDHQGLDNLCLVVYIFIICRAIILADGIQIVSNNLPTSKAVRRFSLNVLKSTPSRSEKYLLLSSSTYQTMIRMIHAHHFHLSPLVSLNSNPNCPTGLLPANVSLWILGYQCPDAGAGPLRRALGKQDARRRRRGPGQGRPRAEICC